MPRKENNSNNENDYCFIIYENENFRKSYYSKLIYKKIWTPGIKQKTHNTLFIFDWDDTLFPTSFLIKEGKIDDDYLSKELKDLFSILEKIILKILRFVQKKGDIYIITNLVCLGSIILLINIFQF